MLNKHIEVSIPACLSYLISAIGLHFLSQGIFRLATHSCQRTTPAQTQLTLGNSQVCPKCLDNSKTNTKNLRVAEGMLQSSCIQSRPHGPPGKSCLKHRACSTRLHSQALHRKMSSFPTGRAAQPIQAATDLRACGAGRHRAKLLHACHAHELAGESRTYLQRHAPEN